MPYLYSPGTPSDDPLSEGIYALSMVATATMGPSTLLTIQMYDPATSNGTGPNSATSFRFVLPFLPGVYLMPGDAVTLAIETASGTSTTTATLVSLATGNPVTSPAVVTLTGGAVYVGEAMQTASTLVLGSGVKSGTTPATASSPVTGTNPLFGIGFRYIAGTTDVDPWSSGPNFPDQYALPSVTSWRFNMQFQVVLPTANGLVNTLSWLYGLTQLDALAASWCSLRALLANPGVTNGTTGEAEATARWEALGSGSLSSPPQPPAVTLLPSAGQLADVYFQPKPRDMTAADVTTPEVPTSIASIGLLVALDIAPGTVIAFSAGAYVSASGNLVNPETGDAVGPDFTWTIQGAGIPAGTVVLFTNIGGSGNVVVEASGGIPAGIVNGNVDGALAIPSLIVTSPFLSGSMPATFVTAVLTAQYTGETPPLTPGYTMNPMRYTGMEAYLPGLALNLQGLPPAVLAAMANALPHTSISLPLNSIELLMSVLVPGPSSACAAFTGARLSSCPPQPPTFVPLQQALGFTVAAGTSYSAYRPLATGRPVG